MLETIDKVADARLRRVPTAELNRFVQEVTAVHPPASPGRRQVRILYAAQIGVAPPTFVFFTNVATEFHFSYQRFLVNQLRESFGLRDADPDPRAPREKPCSQTRRSPVGRSTARDLAEQTVLRRTITRRRYQSRPARHRSEQHQRIGAEPLREVES